MIALAIAAQAAENSVGLTEIAGTNGEGAVTGLALDPEAGLPEVPSPVSRGAVSDQRRIGVDAWCRAARTAGLDSATTR